MQIDSRDAGTGRLGGRSYGDQERQVWRRSTVGTSTQSSQGKLGSPGSLGYDLRVEYLARHESANRGSLVSSLSGI